MSAIQEQAYLAYFEDAVREFATVHPDYAATLKAMTAADRKAAAYLAHYMAATVAAKVLDDVERETRRGE